MESQKKEWCQNERTGEKKELKKFDWEHRLFRFFDHLSLFV